MNMIKAFLVFLCILLTLPGCDGIPALPGIEFTYVPPYGSFYNLKGQVWHVNPDDYKVAVYIYVYGWWNKPTWANPLTSISLDGSWTCDITTDSQDQNATKLTAYLVSNGYNPPLLSGDQDLPAELETNSVAKAEVTRFALSLREIQFSGYTWYVKASEAPIGPGPNPFSDSEDDVWVDQEGRLHMRITNKGGNWYCTEVICTESFGYGEYVFYLDSRLEGMDENMVLGLFTWDDNPEENNREIDIEFSRWGDPLNDNGQFVVQPWDTPGNMHRFEMPEDADQSTHMFNWKASSIFFQSVLGHGTKLPVDSTIVEQWTYSGPYIPSHGNENPRINLWLMAGNAPSNGQEFEVVINKFGFIPEDTNHAPVAVDDEYTATEGENMSVQTPGVLLNDTDADNDTLTAVLVTDVSNGTLTLNQDGSFEYTSNLGFTGMDTFTYKANDGADLSNEATVNVTVESNIPGGPGNPEIEFTYVPPYGSFYNLNGQVWHVNRDDYKVAVYIYVYGWWNKPTWANPLTTIASDGSWTCDITTGGQDRNATKLTAYLVPNGYNPPLLSGDQDLPAELETNSVAKTTVDRRP